MILKIYIYCLLFLISVSTHNESTIYSQSLSQRQPETFKLLSSVFSKKYFVSNTGNDRNTGTLSSPFLTIQKAADSANAGDSVIIRDGVYTTTGTNLIYITKSGTANGYITFRSEHKWGAVLEGGGVSGYGILIANGASYVKFIDFEVRNFKHMGYFCNDQTHQSAFIIIQGNKIHDIGRSSATDPYGRCAVFLRFGNHHWTIDKNLIYNIGRTGPDTYWMNKDHAVYTGTAGSAGTAAYNINITNNLVWGCSGNALNIGSNTTLVANNVFAWTNENSMGGCNFITTEGSGGQYLTVANNIFYQPPTGNAYALLRYSGNTGWAVKNNIVYGGRMWEPTTYVSRGNGALMAGGNYGQTDCEHAEVNPLFVSAIRANAPNVDFSLQSTSPAINAGTDVGLTSDFLGKPINGLPDIGAYEYKTIRQ